MVELKLPDLGEGIHEGEILKWHTEVGRTIREDEPLLEVETDKAAVTIPSPATGVVRALGGKVGDVVLVGEVIVVIEPDAAVDRPVSSAPSPAAVPVEKPRAPAPPALSPAAAPVEKPLAVPDGGIPRPAAPATRRLARELGVDLRRVPATGPGGRITAQDVEKFAAASAHAVKTEAAPSSARTVAPEPAPGSALQPVEAPSPPASRPDTRLAAQAACTIPFLDIEPLPDFTQWGPVERQPLRSIRRRVAHKMTTSKILVPHVAHMDEADVTLLEAFRQRERARRQGQPGGKLTLLSFVIKAVTAGLRATPSFNASLDPFAEEIIFKRHYHIGIAADTGRGLVVPVIRDTDRKSIVQIAADIERLVEQTRAGTIEAEELRGGTFTITNVGPLGGTALIPAINYPEVAILGMGRAQEKPVVRDGQIVIRTMLPLTLAFDHRVADGADAARFVSELVRHLSDPNLLLLET